MEALRLVYCLVDDFSVHDELLGVPERDRMVCMPHGVSAVQIAHATKKYIANNPDKRIAQLVTSLR
jgi:hypothetical protein